MYIYVYICVCSYAYTCTYMHIHVHAYIKICMYICVFMYVYAVGLGTLRGTAVSDMPGSRLADATVGRTFWYVDMLWGTYFHNIQVHNDVQYDYCFGLARCTVHQT